MKCSYWILTCEHLSSTLGSVSPSVQILGIFDIKPCKSIILGLVTSQSSAAIKDDDINKLFGGNVMVVFREKYILEEKNYDSHE